MSRAPLAPVRRCGGAWNNVPSYEKVRDLKDEGLYAAAKEYLSLISAEANGGRFSLKDPRFGITIQWWFENFPSLFNPKIIWVHRDPDGVVGSLVSRDEWAKRDPIRARKVTDQYVEHIRRFLATTKLEHLELKYEDILQNPVENYEKICDYTRTDPALHFERVMKWIRPHFKRN